MLWGIAMVAVWLKRRQGRSGSVHFHGWTEALWKLCTPNKSLLCLGQAALLPKHSSSYSGTAQLGEMLNSSQLTSDMKHCHLLLLTSLKSMRHDTNVVDLMGPKQVACWLSVRKTKIQFDMTWSTTKYNTTQGAWLPSQLWIIFNHSLLLNAAMFGCLSALVVISHDTHVCQWWRLI